MHFIWKSVSQSQKKSGDTQKVQCEVSTFSEDLGKPFPWSLLVHCVLWSPESLQEQIKTVYKMLLCSNMLARSKPYGCCPDERHQGKQTDQLEVAIKPSWTSLRPYKSHWTSSCVHAVMHETNQELSGYSLQFSTAV